MSSVHEVEVSNPRDHEIFTIGQTVRKPVEVRAFAFKNGGAAYRLQLESSDGAF